MKKSLFMFLWLLSLSAFSQEIVIKGKVTDSTAMPLVYANLMAEALHQKQAPVFTMTDQNGHYELHLLKKFSYKVSVLYMGYQPAYFVVDSLSEKSVKNIVLKPKTNQLDQVVIVADLPVKVQQDTITYKTDKFKTGEERKLKDVLKKLPGIEVDKNGSVSVMGKKVSKVLVEGKPFFGGGTKLAVDNIPADAVDKVVAIDDYNSIGFMKGLTDKQKMIINIKLKEGKKHFVFGDLVAGGNTDKNYLAKANLFYYSPKTNLSYIGNTNDIGEAPLNMSDFLRFEGGIGDLGKLKSSFQNFDQISNLIFSDRFLQKNNKFSGLQWQQDFADKLDFSTYIIWSKDAVNTRQSDYNQYFGNTQFIEQKVTNQQENDETGLGKMSLRYKTSPLNYLDFEISGNLNEMHSENNIQSAVNQSQNYIINRLKQKQAQLTVNMAWHRKVNSKNTLRFLSNFVYKHGSPQDIWQTNYPILNQILPLQTSAEYVIQQNRNSDSKNWNFELKHYCLINNNNHIYSSAGNHWQAGNFYTLAYQKLPNHQINDFANTSFNNDLQARLNDAFAGLQYKFRYSKWITKIGIFGHFYAWHFNNDFQTDRTALALLPEITIQKKTQFSKKLSFKYQLKSSIPNINKYLKYYYLTGYNRVQKGNPELQNELMHSFKFNLSDFSFANNYQYYVHLSYNFKPQPVKNKIFYAGTDTYKSPVVITMPDRSFKASLYYKKDFKKFYISFKPDFNWQSYGQNIQNQWFDSQSFTQNYRLKSGTYFKNFPNFDFGISYMVNSHQLENKQSRFRQTSPFLEINYDFLDGFILKADYQYVISDTQFLGQNTYNNGNLSLLYQNDKNPWGLELQISNLFGRSVINQYYQSDVMIANKLIFVQPRIWLLKLHYKL